MSSILRVAARALEAKAKGVSLLPEYKKALEKLKDGDAEPMVEFGDKVQKIISPEGNKPVEWVWSLGTAKRNAINGLYKEITIFKWDSPAAIRNSDVLRQMAVKKVEGWAKALRTLELASQTADQDLEIKHGPFTVVPVPGLTKAQIDQILAALDAASAKIRSKFPQVLYGKVYLATHLKNGVGAWYLATEDKFYIDVSAVTSKKDFDVYAIIHELGHRFDHKFLDKDLRSKFVDLSTRKVFETIKYDSKLREQVADEVLSVVKAKTLGKPVPLMSDQAVLWLKTPHVGDPRKLTSDFISGKLDEKDFHAAIKGKADAEVTTDKVLHGPLAVTPYGAKSPKENFAEAFAHYVLGMKMQPEFVEIMDQLK